MAANVLPPPVGCGLENDCQAGDSCIEVTAADGDTEIFHYSNSGGLLGMAQSHGMWFARVHRYGRGVYFTNIRPPSDRRTRCEFTNTAYCYAKDGNPREAESRLAGHGEKVYQQCIQGAVFTLPASTGGTEWLQCMRKMWPNSDGALGYHIKDLLAVTGAKLLRCNNGNAPASEGGIFVYSTPQPDRIVPGQTGAWATSLSNCDESWNDAGPWPPCTFSFKNVAHRFRVWDRQLHEELESIAGITSVNR